MSFLRALQHNSDDEEQQSTRHVNRFESSSFDTLVSLENSDKAFYGVDYLVEFKSQEFRPDTLLKQSSRSYCESNLKYFCKLCFKSLFYYAVVSHCTDLHHIYKYLQSYFPIEYQRWLTYDVDEQLAGFKNLLQVLTEYDLIVKQVPSVTCVNYGSVSSAVDQYINANQRNQMILQLSDELYNQLSRHNLGFAIFRRFNNYDPSKSKNSRLVSQTSIENLSSSAKRLKHEAESISIKHSESFHDMECDHTEYEKAKNEEEEIKDENLSFVSNENAVDMATLPRRYDLDCQFDEDEDEYAEYIVWLRERVDRVLTNQESMRDGFLNACCSHFNELELDLDMSLKLKQLVLNSNFD